MQVDTKYYYFLGDTTEGNNFINNNYENWFKKAILMAEVMPKRGDLILPFISYAINNNKDEDANRLCDKELRGIEAFCDLIRANNILQSDNLDKSLLKKSISLIKDATDKGIFNDMVFGYWYNKCEKKEFCGHGINGIPLASDIIFLIKDEEKSRLEKIINIDKL